MLTHVPPVLNGSQLRESQPRELRPGRTFPKGRDLCGGSRPFSWQSETRAAGFVCRMQGDPLDCTDRDDEVFELAFLRLDAKRQEPETGLARKRMERQPLTVAELNLDVRT